MTQNKPSGLGQLLQVDINFEKLVHERENNKFSQQHLDNNRYHFTGQVLAVFEWLKRGILVTSLFAAQNNVSRLASRINDVGDKGELDIDREYALDKDGKPTKFLAYFLPQNRAKFMEEKKILNRPRWWYSDKYTPMEVIEQIKAQTL